MQERRQRIRVETPVLIEFPNPDTMKTERSFTHDISDAGLRFPTPVKLQIGQELALSLSLPYHTKSFHATGEIVWVREVARLGATQYEIGMRFRWIEDPDRGQLSRFLQSVFSARV